VKIHIVKRGDTLYKLSEKYNVDLKKLIQMNPHIEDPDQIDIGEKVKIPTSTPVVDLSPEFIKHKHAVKQGDSLWKLSKAWDVPLIAMIKANPQLKSKHALLTGEVVNIPDMEKMEDASQAATAQTANSLMDVHEISEQPEQNYVDTDAAISTPDSAEAIEKPGVQAEQLPTGGVSPMDVHVPMEQQDENLFQQFQIPATESFSWNPEGSEQAANANAPNANAPNANAPNANAPNANAPNAPYQAAQEMAKTGMDAFTPYLQNNVYANQNVDANTAANAYASFNAEFEANASMYGGYVNPYAQVQGFPGFQPNYEPDLTLPYTNHHQMNYMPQGYDMHGMQQPASYPYYPQPYEAPYFGAPGMGYPEMNAPVGFAHNDPWMIQHQHGDCGCGGMKTKQRSEERYALVRQAAVEKPIQYDLEEDNNPLSSAAAKPKAKKRAKAQVKGQKKKKSVKAADEGPKQPWINF
jgi:LysM repeat protein